MDHCERSVERFLRRDLAEWTGLAPGCAEDELAARLPFREGYGVARMGARQVEYTFRALPHEGFPEGVFFHFRDGRLALVACDYWSFDPQECADLLRGLGGPEHRLDLYWKDEVVKAAEWVYPGRGIAVGVIPATGLVAQLAVFPPCTLHEYEERYRGTETARELPGR